MGNTFRHVSIQSHGWWETRKAVFTVFQKQTQFSKKGPTFYRSGKLPSERFWSSLFQESFTSASEIGTSSAFADKWIKWKVIKWKSLSSLNTMKPCCLLRKAQNKGIPILISTMSPMFSKENNSFSLVDLQCKTWLCREQVILNSETYT